MSKEEPAGTDYVLEHRGVTCLIRDAVGSKAVEGIIREIQNGDYDLPFDAQAGIIIDIGAHVGCFCILAAKLYPDIKIMAFEPFPSNFELLTYNARVNKVSGNLNLYEAAITKDGRDFPMVRCIDNTGGATGCVYDTQKPGHETSNPLSVKLDDVIASEGRIALLKIDCEGAEHEILTCSTKLDSISALVGEFHENDFIRSNGYSIEGLKAVLRWYHIPFKIQECEMANF